MDGPRFETSGAKKSDPVSKADERAWCLLESRVRRGARVRLGRGWYDLEAGTYRWTAPSFSISLLHHEGSTLRFRFTSVHPMTLSGDNLPAAEYPEPGEHIYTARLPENFSGELNFRIDPPLRAPGDQRELGVMVGFWKRGVETTDDNVPIEVVS